MLQSTGQAVVAEAASKAPSLENIEEIPRINSVRTWLPRWQLLFARKASTYGAAVLTVVLYCLVLLNCNVAFIGLAYIIVAVWCLAVQPQKGKWRVDGGADVDSDVLHSAILGVDTARSNQQILSAPSGASSSRVELVGSSILSWIPLFVATLLATLDFIVQVTLPAVAANVYISEEILNFLKTAVGVDFAPTSKELALGLLRPTLILACIYAFRRLYSIGILHRQLAHAAVDQEEYEQRRLAKQWGVGAFVKRCLILHASKLVVLVAFAAAMQDPSALGWCFVGKNNKILCERDAKLASLFLHKGI
jgi:hypothetical protein